MEILRAKIKRVATSGGIILEDYEFKEDGKTRWFNIYDKLKSALLPQLKAGQEVELTVHERDLISECKILQEAPKQDAKKEVRQAKDITNESFEGLIEVVNILMAQTKNPQLYIIPIVSKDEMWRAVVTYTKEVEQ